MSLIQEMIATKNLKLQADLFLHLGLLEGQCIKKAHLR